VADIFVCPMQCNTFVDSASVARYSDIDVAGVYIVDTDVEPQLGAVGKHLDPRYRRLA